jgi:antitoxin HicB
MPSTYSIVLRPEPEGGFTVRVPAFPEIVTFGENETEALEMAREAIELVIESRTERGESIATPDAPLFREVTVSAVAA